MGQALHCRAYVSPYCPYEDRRQAGRKLIFHVAPQLAGNDPVILALPRGGVPVAFEIAIALGLPLDVLVVRKLGLPEMPELGLGAIGSGGYQILNERLIASLHMDRGEIERVAAAEQITLRRREGRYRSSEPPLDLAGRSVLLVDDGLATGYSMRVAIAAARQQGALRLVVAAPVGAADACEELALYVNAVVCPLRPSPFGFVGAWYEDFSSTSDDEVCDELAAARADYARRQFHPA